MQDQDLVHDQPDATSGHEMVELQNEVSGNLQSGDLGIANGWADMWKYPPDTEMQILATGKTQHYHNVENGVGVLQALAILEYMAIYRHGVVLKIQDVLGFRSKL